MSTTAAAPKMHRNSQLKVVPMTYSQSLGHGIGTNSLLTNRIAYVFHSLFQFKIDQKRSQETLLVPYRNRISVY